MRRDEDPEDRRAKTVVLTDEGRAVTAKMEEELFTLRAQALKGVSRDDLEAALRVLEAFTTDATEREESGSGERDTRRDRAQPSRPEPARREPTKRTSSAKREPAKRAAPASKVKPTSAKTATKTASKSRGTVKARKSTKRGARATAPHNAGSA
jgi:MarR family transcriptional regulator for hemolysin